jgi:excisionase family DNA binding protein
MTMPAKKQLKNIRLTTKNIADYCQVTKSTVLVWITSGKLKAFTLPSGHNRIDVKDFKEFLTKYNMPVKSWPFETR